MVNRFASMAQEAGANCLVTACPVCMGNLDMRAEPSMGMPVFYFTELMAVALGLPGGEVVQDPPYGPDAARASLKLM